MCRRFRAVILRLTIGLSVARWPITKAVHRERSLSAKKIVLLPITLLRQVRSPAPRRREDLGATCLTLSR